MTGVVLNNVILDFVEGHSLSDDSSAIKGSPIKC